MRTLFLGLAAPIAAVALPVSLAAQEAPEGAPSPGQIVAAAEAEEWMAIPAEDLLVMTLAPDSEGNTREVVIQLMPAPFLQGWVENIRTLARAEWYDGISVNRVQDNYVVQWGDPGYDNPESGEVEPKALPNELNVMSGEDYTAQWYDVPAVFRQAGELMVGGAEKVERVRTGDEFPRGDPFASMSLAADGWPLALEEGQVWPVHCYGMVGVGRNYSPDTGSGAELYTVIGHAPRHLDRNIALVGRIISGIEHLSSLPRGKGELGFYAEEEADKRTPILSVRVSSDLPEGEQPASSSKAVGNKYAFEYLSTESETFAKYAEARANRRDPFFIKPAGGADICNIPVPIRQVASE